MICHLHFPQVSTWAFLSVFADHWGYLSQLVTMWRGGNFCDKKCCDVSYLVVLCGRPWHDVLSMLLHSYMSERSLWDSIHIWSIVSHRIPFCEGRSHDYHQFVSQPTPFQSIIQIDHLDTSFGHSVCWSQSTSLCVHCFHCLCSLCHGIHQSQAFSAMRHFTYLGGEQPVTVT